MTRSALQGLWGRSYENV